MRIVEPGDVLIHIGVYKTGSTALQASLMANRPALADAGVLYPGRRRAQSMGAAAVLGMTLGWGPGARTRPMRHWRELKEEVAAWPGTVVISSELLCTADDDGADRVLASFPGRRIKILAALRPLEQLLPSSWQQYVKSGLTRAYDEWLSAILDGAGGSDSPSFWKRNRHAEVVRRWADRVGTENLAVWAVDSSRPDHLFRQFEEVIGVPDGFLQPAPDHHSNRSLTLAEAELLRHFNMWARRELDYADFRRLVQNGAVEALVETRRPGPDEPRVATPAWAVRRARELQAPLRDALAGLRVIGNADLLFPEDEPKDPERTTPTVVGIDAAAALLRGAVAAALADRA